VGAKQMKKIFIFSGELKNTGTLVRSPEMLPVTKSNKTKAYPARCFSRITNLGLDFQNKAWKCKNEPKTKEIKNMVNHDPVTVSLN
jgi:hypothetical protein